MALYKLIRKGFKTRAKLNKTTNRVELAGFS